MIKFVSLALLLAVLSGCTSIAKVSNFETNASQINFTQLANLHNSTAKAGWTWQGKNEYFINVKAIEKAELSEKLINALDEHGYSLVKKSEDGSAIIGDKGIRLNEWWSVIGVYFSATNDGHQVYIKVELTQDITGGWTENRAKSFAKYFCSQSKLCIDA